MLRFGHAIAACLLTTTVSRADLEPPVAGRPEHFSGAVGVFRLKVEAAPTEVVVEEPVILTVTVTGTVSADYPRFHPPERLKMEDLGDLQEDFQVDDLPQRNDHQDAHAWKYHFRLRPRNTQVRRIPRLGLVYYNPETGTWPTSYSAESIPLKVKPRPAVPAEDFNDPGDDFGKRYPLVTGEAVLQQQVPPRIPGGWLLALMFTVPPVLCVVWYQLWRSWYPDAARLAGRRRSRASRLALQQLRALPGGLSLEDAGGKVAAVLGRYLHQRLDLPFAEPTPAEVLEHLNQTGVAPRLAARFSSLLATCDAARFALPAGSPPADLAADAARLIRDLEAEACLCAPC